jgi:hypothetical protein
MAGAAAWLALAPIRGHRSEAAGAATATDATGSLEGTVTLTCRPSAADCRERPYQIGLFLADPRTGREIEPIRVSAAGRFAISAAPGTYRIVSADARGACCLPILRPIPVTIVAGRVVRVHVRFEPGLQLPTR